MDNETPTKRRSDRWGPELYVHLEFRVSWGKKQPPNNHQVTFRSRGPRERTPDFPRQVAAPNTNYLAAIHTFEQRQSRIRELRQQYVNQSNNTNPHRHHQMQEYYQGEQQLQQPPYLQVPIIREPQRPTRADARPSHERGRSAPPPIGENPWDVNVPHTIPPTDSEIRRKPLPAPPSQFRLGEGGQPWSTWSLPDGYDPDAHPGDDDNADEEKRGRTSTTDYFYSDARSGTHAAAADRNSTTYATNPTMVSTFSPEPAAAAAPPPPPPAAVTAATNPRDLETGRARELGALSAAMMTVDNGFETQWWYQGTRASVAVDADPGPDHQHPDPGTPDGTVESPVHRWSAGPTVYSAMDDEVLESPVGEGTLRRAMTGFVSPMTEAAFSPAPQEPAGLLMRSMSTRSEELWFTERGR
ncbi:hypothetical protein C8A05DRAFT_29888 [Staphylotrichum tortipilum]|uniref:Uncharacterized protein n=1 Tax=Staphylotrichum tortipilum TaxID=2831512 RepID=A0AAN6MTU0_9PEZI|nr:hypothetical protein C8A05DRAFT_29888 [Staphylotrichum longicolle]